MHLRDGRYIYSASDLASFLECPHFTGLCIQDLKSPLPKDEPDAQGKLIIEKGLAHERVFLEKLKSTGQWIAEISPDEKSLEREVEETITALKAGPEYVYQAVLYRSPFLGYADFLKKVDIPSKLGSYSYEVMDAKLSKHVRPYYVIQLCFYSELLGEVQGRLPDRIHVVLGNCQIGTYQLKDFYHYYLHLKRMFLEQVGREKLTYPEPCDYCSKCKYRTLCAQKWIADDHLSLVANIRKSQITSLRRAGIETLESLARTKAKHVRGIADKSFQRLRKQGELQLHFRRTNRHAYHLLEFEDETTGLALLPDPDDGDLFFDIEGDPLYPDNLEYLFGVLVRRNNQEVFRDFWAHNHRQEKEVFEGLVKFFIKELELHPRMHIYHYNHYEVTALKRLMCKYGSMESQIDHLLREKVFVDLYKVVRQSMILSTSGYSLKDIEALYAGTRQADITSADASIVYYENYLLTGDPKLLDSIREYNLEDCRSLS